MLSELMKWAPRRPAPATSADAAAKTTEGAVMASKAFPRFLNLLSQHPAPILLDFGPVVGDNVGFFGDRLGCKLYIEDVLTDITRHLRASTLDDLTAGFETRFRHADGAIDGILCWDCFDFLPKAAGQALARQIVRMLKPGGAAMGFFCTSGVPSAPFTKFEVVDEGTLKHRPHAGASGARLSLANREILRMFEGLSVSDSFLLKNNIREMLLRRS
jgi:hypothetical protein